MEFYDGHGGLLELYRWIELLCMIPQPRSKLGDMLLLFFGPSINWAFILGKRVTRKSPFLSKRNHQNVFVRVKGELSPPGRLAISNGECIFAAYPVLEFFEKRLVR
jgi:hypothetical protein